MPCPVSKRGKEALISLSSSSASSCDQDEEEQEDAEEESPDDCDDDDDDDEEDDDEDESEQDDLSSDEDYGPSSCNGRDDDDDDDDGSDDYDASKGAAGEEICGRVVDLLRRGKSLNILRLDECKAYLRKHELRLSGTKATCIDRILEHWRLKDQDGEKLYPMSSFVIDCTGDVCKGDVILFKQRVYRKFDVVRRGANIIGKRTIAGRVVKESYGAAKQQHTFTVEIFWCKGVKALPLLFPLLVKGRNLYRLKTFRQRWKIEAERSKVLAEKHSRGAAARHVRKLAKAKCLKKGSKRRKVSSSKSEPSNKRQKREKEPARITRNSESASSNSQAKIKQVRKGRHPARIAKKPDHRSENASSHGQAKIKQVRKARHTGSSVAHLKQTHPSSNHYYPQRGSHQLGHIAASQAIRGPYHISNYNAGHFSTPNTWVHHQASNQGSSIGHPYPDSMSQLNPSSSSNIWRRPEFNNGPHVPPGMQVHRWWPP